ncbi:MAG: TerB family tellurite resistance protein [Deltaproteobacteria bacterium]|nr:TerB family tellurite resistance protein [Deltaproteobacteria bacterium]
MQPHEEAILKSLVAVAWADGRVDGDESEVIDALLEAFGVDGEAADGLREFAKEERSIDDIPLTELSATDRRMLLQHAVIVTWVDGEQHEKELEVLDKLAARLNLPEDEAKALREAANDRAKRMLELS